MPNARELADRLEAYFAHLGLFDRMSRVSDSALKIEVWNYDAERGQPIEIKATIEVKEQ